jgi:type VI secretion system protein ImpH
MESMASALRQQTPSLVASFLSEPYTFEFFPALCLAHTLSPHLKPVGKGLSRRDEVISLQSAIHFSVPPSDLLAVDLSTDHHYTVTVNFLGLAGEVGPLPRGYTEWIVQQETSSFKPLSDFLDIFNHRLLALFFQMQLKHRLLPPFQDQHPPAAQHLLFALAGQTLLGKAQDQPPPETPLPQHAFLKYAAHFWRQPHSATALECLLRDFFQLGVQVEEFVGDWFPLRKQDHTHLGRPGASQILGQGATLGDRIWLQGEKIRLHLSDLSFDLFQSLLPGGALNRQMSYFVRHYLKTERKLFDFSLALSHDAIPRLGLGNTHDRLGWLSWMALESLKEGQAVIVCASD